MSRFEGRTCITTGAASGIGREITLGLAAEGALVVANDIDEKGLARYDGHPSIHPVLGDTSDRSTASNLVQRAMELTGRIDILVNNAGIGRPGPAERLPTEDWDRCLAVNLTAYFLLAKAAGSVMIEQRSGVVLNVASTAGLAAVPENIAYVTTKHGVVGMTRSLAVDWARYGIRANALCPGLTETDLIRRREAQEPEKFRVRRQRIPNGRIAQPVEQARVALFLLSDDASYVNGLIAQVDAGGFALYSGFAPPELEGRVPDDQDNQIAAATGAAS